MSLNKICIMGRMTADPELKNTPSGTSVVSFTLAVDRNFKDKQTGEKTVDFIPCTAWRQTAEFVSRYFAKGRMAVVDGSLQMRKWTDKDGNKRTSAEVVAENVYFGDAKSGNTSESAPADLPWDKPVEDDDDGIPF